MEMELLQARPFRMAEVTIGSQKNHPHYGSPTNSSRESLQRKWWLPYAVLEFDKNEVLIDALGGEMSNPVWQYRAH
ncbi:hypothetical protein BGZ90_007356, partial [Linnemannia elongata]